ncbi:MAG TPA: arylsulfatase [Candidatus Paceibacterota bacterium]|nr:arylsulfatase [Verrucomicrobiota bacterium]HSA11641.1 arylsulfatase [Candidatus Paceibacterota bacterium]
MNLKHAALIGFASLILALGTDGAAVGQRPNIAVILVDDMGFSDLGCYGSEIPTPNLDKLAARGLRFTQFYNTGRCCPTRASLLTGLYPHQAGVGHMVTDRQQPGYQGNLNDRCVTLAEVLSSAGYRTVMAGKWHVTRYTEPADETEKANWPRQRGFDHYFGVIKGTANYFRPDSLARENEHIQPPAEGFYTTDAFVDNALKFIEEGEQTRPFFLYLAFNAPHFPLMAPAEEIAKFRGKYKIGWDKLREQRRARQIELGIVDKAWPLSPRAPEVKAWDTLTPQEQDRFDHIMAIYAAVVAHMDTAVGRFVDTLRRRGALDNTLILFLSDNGGNAEAGPEGRYVGQPPGSADSNVFCGQSWATLENTPFRRYKHYNHEGGISTPLIAHWPARISIGGGLRPQPGHLIDIMATCVEVAGAAYPKEYKGKVIQPMEGRSLVPAFDNQPIKRDALYWEHEGNAAVRVGDWKLVRQGRKGPWELYDLKADRTEQRDLAAAQPERARELAAKWDAWAERAQVKPYPTGDPADTGARKKKGKKKQAGAG